MSFTRTCYLCSNIVFSEKNKVCAYCEKALGHRIPTDEEVNEYMKSKEFEEMMERLEKYNRIINGL